jgi:hypothetical protein
VSRAAGIEDPTTYLLTKNEESQKKVNSTPTKAHGARRNQGLGSGNCISSHTRLLTSNTQNRRRRAFAYNTIYIGRERGCC